MSCPSALFALPDSDFGERVVDASNGKVIALPLDEAFDDGCVSISTAAITEDRTALRTSATWSDRELIRQGAPLVERALIERPVFSWPQPWCQQVPPLNVEDAAREAERLHSARALTISLLRHLEDLIPVANRPSLALLAATPAISLARAQRKGHPVHPWSLSPADPSGAEHGASPLLGSERWVSTSQSAQENHGASILHAPIEGPLRRLLVVGGSIAGSALVEVDSNATTKTASIGNMTPDARSTCVPEERLELHAPALQACTDLGLTLAAVTVSERSPAILWIDSAPDLLSWDEATAGAVHGAVAAWLTGSDSPTAVHAGTPHKVNRQ